MGIDAGFETFMSSLTNYRNDVSTALQGDQKRPWMNFQWKNKAGQFEWDNLHKLFDRQSLNDSYQVLKAAQDTKAKDVITIKLEADYLGACERDYKMRIRSRIRSFIHSGVAAAYSEGSNDGPIRRQAMDWLTRIQTEDQSV